MDQVHETAEELVSLVGDPDKPEVEKNVDDLDAIWNNVNEEWTKRQKALNGALGKANSFTEQLMVWNSFLMVQV